MINGGKTTFRCFTIEGGEVAACLAHHGDNLIVGDAVGTLGEGGVDVGIEGAAGGVGVAFDTGDLDETADRVAGHTEVVLKTHLGSVFGSFETTAEAVVGSSGGHRAGYSDFGLASGFCTGDGGEGFGDVTDKTCGGKGVEHADTGGVAGRGDVVKNAREYATAATGGGGDDAAATGILFADGEGIGEDETTRLEVLAVAEGLDIVAGSLTLEVETTGENAFAFETTLNGSFHDLPNFVEIVPYFRAFAGVDIVPIVHAASVAPLHDVGEVVEFVDIGGINGRRTLFGESTTTDGIDGPGVVGLSVEADDLELHAVGMEFGYGVGFPDDLCAVRTEDEEDGLVGKVAFARCGEGAVEGDAEGDGFGVFCEVLFGGSAGAHGVRR